MGFLSFPYQMLCFNYPSKNIVSNLYPLKFSELDELSAFTGYLLAILISWSHRGQDEVNFQINTSYILVTINI